MRDSRFLPVDFVTLGYLVLVSAGLVVAAAFGVGGLAWPIAAHVGLASAVIGIVACAGDRRSGPLALLRYWYPLVLVPVAFRLNGIIVPKVNPRDLDMVLLGWDRALFGAHPAVYLGWLETPWMTEVLRWCWLSYFAMPFAVAIPLYARGRAARDRYAVAVFALVAGWLSSYLAYFATPAIGPGYYTEQVGEPPVVAAAASSAVLSTLFALEGDVVRDVCPSGHLIIAMITVWIAFSARMWLRWPLAVLAVGLTVATVYLRYHYGVDLVFGAVIAAVVIAVAPRVHRPNTHRLPVQPGERMDAV